MERADVIMVTLEAMINTNMCDIFAACKVLKMILKYSIPEVGKVPSLLDLMIQGLFEDSFFLFCFGSLFYLLPA